MRYLVDTHSLLWLADDESKLSVPAKSILENQESALCFSVVSAWEIAIKTSIGKLQLNISADKWISDSLDAVRLELLPIKLNHVSTVANLPFHHRDPFDRMLAAQCLVENISIISIDS